MNLETAQKNLQSAQLPTSLKETITDTLERLNHLQESKEYYAEYDSLLRYVDWVVTLPWNKESEDQLDLKKAKEILDERHYGLSPIKERILEYLSVRKLQSREGGTAFHAPILCFTGLQGSGKTTLATSIAKALGRQFERVSLGAIGTTSQLRGRPRSEADSEPGQIIKALRRAGTKNPVILLDEIDKVSGESSLRNDVMASLLEILDPEQNPTFRDHYIDFPFDLSKVAFICTANDLVTVSPALLDRMEVVQMPAYSDEEKITIGRDYLLPQIAKENGLKDKEVVISADLWPKIVRPLGFDAGLRTLERNLDTITRRVAKRIVTGQGQSFTINDTNLKEFLETY
jgi:ATP-dependent Lon protease